MSVPTAGLIDGEVGQDVRTVTAAAEKNSSGSLSSGSHHIPSAHRRLLHDPSIPFEEYLYYAEITRREEEAANELYLASRGPTTIKSLIKDRFSKGHHHVQPPTVSGDASANEKAGNNNNNNGIPVVISSVTPAEWKNASRAMRTAGWGGVFYLITTDILGPFSAPWAFAQMGYGPGIALYTVFGIMSYYSGWIIYKTFLGLDSDRYPLKGYGDLYFRTFGSLARHLVNFAQGLQLLLFVSVLILANGMAISQISQGPDGGAGICFVACMIIFMAAGFLLGQIRTLQRFSWVANAAVWLNLVVLFITMGVVANSLPNFKATVASFGEAFAPGPILKFAGTPPEGLASGGSGFIGSLNGLNQAVYSYGGCMVFAAFLAEMRHPRDFWKSLLIAECFIYAVYLFFGVFVYSYQGQYTFNPAPQGIAAYGWQTACNIILLFSSCIGAALYGNIGLKVLYIDVLQEVLHFPPLTASRGKWLWAGLVPVYWAIAFVVGAAIPLLSSISGFIGAMFILSFTYTLPALLALGYWIRKDAMVPAQERFDPATGRYNYIDGGWKRWARGYMARPWFNTWNLVYLLGGLATTALGMYSSIDSMIHAFQGGSKATSFGCASPV